MGQAQRGRQWPPPLSSLGATAGFKPWLKRLYRLYYYILISTEISPGQMDKGLNIAETTV